MTNASLSPLDPRDLPEIVLENTYFPELDYAARNYQPFGTRTKSNDPRRPDTVVGPSEHFCDRCLSYYGKLRERKVFDPAQWTEEGRDWPIVCYGDLSQRKDQYTPEVLDDMVEKGFLEDTVEARDYFLTSMDPVAWAKEEFNLDLDWYQGEIVNCSAQWKVVRGGRRIGKSVAKEVRILYSAFTKMGKSIDRYEIMVICPYEVQVKKIFSDLALLISRSRRLTAAVKRSTKGPYEIELYNGSVIRGFSSGKKGGARSDKIRSQGANEIYFDEMDFMADEDIEATLAVQASQKDTLVYGSTTPTGARSKFWRLCIDKKLQYKEHHYISAESPRWSSEVERMMLAMYSAGGFMREFLAEFGTPTEGVFNQKQLDKALREYTYEKCVRTSHFRYIMGVDWNELTGTHMVVLEQGWKDLEAGRKDIYYRLVDKVIVRKAEFLHHETMKTMLKLDMKWKCDYVYVDQGYGAVQVENLYRQDLENPHLNLRYAERLIAVHGNQNVVLKDPRNPGVEIKKKAKPFMVDLLAAWIDNNRIFFPASEDTHKELNEQELPFLDIGIIQQMRNFRIEKVSRDGQPLYSQGYEHTLMALCFAALGMAMKFSEINEINIDGTLAYSPTPLGVAKDPNMTEGELDEKRRSDLARVKSLHDQTRPNRTVDSAPPEVDIYGGGATPAEFNYVMQTGIVPKKRQPYHTGRFGPPRRTIP